MQSRYSCSVIDSSGLWACAIDPGPKMIVGILPWFTRWRISQAKIGPSFCSCRESVDDYVGPDNVVRFIDAFVDGLDLGAAGFVRV